MVAIAGTDRNGRTDVSLPDFDDLQKNSRLIESFIAGHLFGTTLSIGDRAERATGSVVSAKCFDALGIHPIQRRPDCRRLRPNPHPQFSGSVA